MSVDYKVSLIWSTSKLSGQDLPVMFDTGATPNCIALRCVLGSSILSKLPRKPYQGKGVIDANGNFLKPKFVISPTLVLGSPSISLQTTFIVVDTLPFSCILGQNTFSKFSKWTINNIDKCIIINDTSRIPFQSDPPISDFVQLLTTNKVTIEPNQFAVVNTRAHGLSLSAFRPVTNITVLSEANCDLANRLHIEVLPSVCLLTHQNCPINISVFNTSTQRKTIKKGVSIATCEHEYDVINLIDTKEPERVNCLDNPSDPIDILCKQMTHLSHTEYVAARQLLIKHKDLFSISNNKIGRTSTAEFDIDVNKIDPVSVPLRRVPVHHHDIVSKIITKYEQLGLVEPIDSPFRASTVLVRKKNVSSSSDITDQYRLCTDYRSLNRVLPQSGWPSPSLNECLDAANGSTIFSSIDFNSGYHQIPCTERAKEALAFSPGYGFKQYTWSVMPQGIKSASGSFQRTMQQTFKGNEHRILPPYYDDIIIKGNSFKQHLDNVNHILQDLKKANFTLNTLKCSFFQPTIKYLGHVINRGRIMLDPDRLQSISSIPVPSNVTEVRRFIGMAQFCSRFIPNINIVLSPLYELLKSNHRYYWSNECQIAFLELKRLLCSPPVLHTPSSKDYFILETDACTTGLGGCLKAIDNITKQEYIVAYHSKKFSANELNWNIVEQEAYSVVHNVNHFRHYLIGKKFTIRVDNRIVTYIQSKQHPKNRKLLNWSLQLSEYDYDIVHIPGKNNCISDCLSRIHDNTKNNNKCQNNQNPDTFVLTVHNQNSDISHHDLQTSQNNDIHIQACLNYVKNNKSFDVNTLGPYKRFRKHLSTHNDVLLWKGKYVIPPDLRHKILTLCHDHPTAGHFAVQRTLDQFQRKFFWPTALSDVSNWVKSCTKCNEFNPPKTGYIKAPIQPIESDNRFQLVCYDLAGPFIPVTVRGNRYVLIIVDHFSHWPEFVPLSDITAPLIARAIMDQWCCRYGIPERLHSDGANNVHGHVIRELSKYLGLEKSKSSRLHPQGDGTAEAFVKQLKSCVQKQVTHHGADWDLHIQSAAFAIRSSIANSTHFTPAELILGTKLTRPIDKLIPTEDQTQPVPYNQKQAAQFSKSLIDKMVETINITRDNLSKSRKHMKNTFDKHHSKVTPIHTGDQVMLWTPYKKPGLSRCFQPNWAGPWVIQQFTGPTNCKLINGEGQIKNVHINQLKVIKKRLITQTSNSKQNSSNHKTNNNNQPLDPINSRTTIFDLEHSEEPNNNDIPGIPPPQQLRGDIINRAWVEISQDNIIPNRTRTRDREGGV